MSILMKAGSLACDGMRVPSMRTRPCSSNCRRTQWDEMHIDRETASAGRRRPHMAGRAGRGRFRRKGGGASETSLLRGIVSTVEETLDAALRSATELDEGKRRHRRAIKTCWAYPDLVLSDPATVCDAATFAGPTKSAEGTLKTWINGVAGKGAVAEHAGDWGRDRP